MKCVHFIYVIVPSVAIAQLPPPVTTTTLLFTRVVERTITIELGDALETVRPVPVIPTTVDSGARVRLVATRPGEKYDSVTWFKGLTELTATGGTLEISSATPADTGSYRARVTGGDRRFRETSEAFLFVDEREGPRLLNVSARVQLTFTQPSFVAGFTIQSAPWPVLVLIRVVGPSLARFGVPDALSAPQLRVFDARGAAVPTAGFPSTSVTVDQAASRAGAFPLESGAGDVAQLFYLLPGAYTAQASAPSGSTGTVLLEVYEVSAREALP